MIQFVPDEDASGRSWSTGPSPAAEPWLGRELLVARAAGRACGRATTRGVVREELRGARGARLQRDALVLLLARLRPRAGAARRRRPRPVRRLPRRARGARARDDPDLPRRPHVGRELGSGLARRARPLPRRLARVAAGVVRRPRSRGASAAHPAVVGWLVSNEMPLYGGPASADEIAAWARLDRRRPSASAGATQPISLGDGAWGVEVTGRDNGYSLRALAPLVDFVGPHTYPMQDDEVRQLLTPAFACELAGSFGKPVVLEEFGVSSDFAADDHAARLLPAGAPHDAARRRARLARLVQRRLRRPARPGSVPAPRLRAALRPDRPRGTAEAGAPRAASVLGVRSSATWPTRGFERVAGDAAIVVPEHFERVLPFTEQAVPRRPARQPAAGLRRRPRGRPPGRARPRARRDPRRRAPLPAAERQGRSPRPGLDRLPQPRRGRRDGLRVRIRRQHQRTSAGRGSRGWTRSSASGTASATGSSTRSRTTRSCSSSSSRSATCRRARRSRSAPAGRRARTRTCRSSPPARPSSPSTATAARRSCATTLGAGRTVLLHVPARAPRRAERRA